MKLFARLTLVLLALLTVAGGITPAKAQRYRGRHHRHHYYRHHRYARRHHRYR